MVTLAKRDTLHARRQVLRMVPDAGVVGRLFSTIAPRLGDRHGGYTRLIKAGRRPGDNAPLVLLELVDRAETPKDKEKKGERSEKAPRGEAGATGKRKKREKAAAQSA
jgi:large subunit ribosomal protein L17